MRVSQGAGKVTNSAFSLRFYLAHFSQTAAHHSTGQVVNTHPSAHPNNLSALSSCSFGDDELSASGQTEAESLLASKLYTIIAIAISIGYQASLLSI